MLYAYFDRNRFMKYVPNNLDNWFSQRMEQEWLMDPRCTKYIKELDNSDFLPPYNVISPVFGSISIDWLSGTCKTILQMIFITDVFHPSSYLGDNTARALEEISKEVNINLLINHPFKFLPTTKIYFP